MKVMSCFFILAMKYIQLERKAEDIVLIIINRPEVLNAINKEVISELCKAIDIVGADDTTKVVILTGSGERSFCAGADIRYVININPIEAERYASSVHTLLNKIENLEKPVIAAINGYALGGGCEIALACDIRIASTNAKIGQTEVKIGIPPGWGGTQRMLRIIGQANAKQLVFTGQMITAEKAFRIGLVNRVIGVDTSLEGTRFDQGITKKEILSKNEETSKILNQRLIDECIKLAKEIAKNSYNAVKVSKMLINKSTDADLETGLRLEIYGWSLCFAHEDRQRMMSAFLNNRELKT